MTTSEPLPPAAAHPILIDALNLAYWCGRPPSLRLPLSVMVHLLAARCPAQLYFDASARYRFGDEVGVYERLLQHPLQVIEVPSGRTADGVMLRQARSSGGCIISRDRFRDYRQRYRKLIDDPSRLMPGLVENDRVRLPGLGIDVPLLASADEAWVRMEALMQSRLPLPQGEVDA